jgi:hypothetical protein
MRIISSIIKKELYNYKRIYNLGSKNIIFKNNFLTLITKIKNMS